MANCPRSCEAGVGTSLPDQSGEVKAVPSDFLEAVKIVTAGVSCVNCRHVHGLVGGACSAEKDPAGTLVAIAS